MTKIVTIKKIATEMGVAVSTVSKALNGYPDVSESTRNAIVQKALSMGYSPNLLARNLVRSTSNIIGLIVRDISSIYGEMFSEIQEVAREKNLMIMLCDSKRNKELEKRHVRTLMDSRVRGLIIAPVDSDTTDINSIVCGRIPTVYYGETVSDDSENYVCSDSRIGITEALQHLYDLGHRQIAFLCGSIKRNSTRIKADTYTEYMTKHNLEPVVVSYESENEYLSSRNREVAENFFKTGKKATAVVCSKDSYAISLMRLAIDRGLRIPEDLSIIGYDGSGTASLPMIQLTTIEQNRREVAENLIQILLDQSEEPSETDYKHCAVTPFLVIRESTAKK